MKNNEKNKKPVFKGARTTPLPSATLKPIEIKTQPKTDSKPEKKETS